MGLDGTPCPCCAPTHPARQPLYSWHRQRHLHPVNPPGLNSCLPSIITTGLVVLQQGQEEEAGWGELPGARLLPDRVELWGCSTGMVSVPPGAQLKPRHLLKPKSSACIPSPPSPQPSSPHPIPIIPSPSRPLPAVSTKCHCQHSSSALSRSELSAATRGERWIHNKVGIQRDPGEGGGGRLEGEETNKQRNQPPHDKTINLLELG